MIGFSESELTILGWIWNKTEQNLEKLKESSGDQNYSFENIDMYDTVVVCCQPFGVHFGQAKLDAVWDIIRDKVNTDDDTQFSLIFFWFKFYLSSSLSKTNKLAKDDAVLTFAIRNLLWFCKAFCVLACLALHAYLV